VDLKGDYSEKFYLIPHEITANGGIKKDKYWNDSNVALDITEHEWSPIYGENSKVDNEKEAT